MLLDKLNLNHLRIFEAVHRLGGMTQAAQALHLTQSGISQHIKALEDMLETKLFDRVHQRLIPTSSAKILYERCTLGLQTIEQALLELKGLSKEHAGTITLGVPIEFGNNIVIPLLSKFSRKHPLVKFKIRMGFASAIAEELLKGDMDFAFVDDYRMDKRISTERVFDETLELCISEELLKNYPTPKLSSDWFEQLGYVEYQVGEPVLRMWFNHHLGPREGRRIGLNVKATVMDVQGIARFISHGAGAGVLPKYLADQMDKTPGPQKIYRFKGCGKPMINRISLATLHERTQSSAAAAVQDFLKENL